MLQSSSLGFAAPRRFWTRLRSAEALHRITRLRCTAGGDLEMSFTDFTMERKVDLALTMANGAYPRGALRPRFSVAHAGVGPDLPSPKAVESAIDRVPAGARAGGSSASAGWWTAVVARARPAWETPRRLRRRRPPAPPAPAPAPSLGKRGASAGACCPPSTTRRRSRRRRRRCQAQRGGASGEEAVTAAEAAVKPVMEAKIVVPPPPPRRLGRRKTNPSTTRLPPPPRRGSR